MNKYFVTGDFNQHLLPGTRMKGKHLQQGTIRILGLLVSREHPSRRDEGFCRGFTTGRPEQAAILYERCCNFVLGDTFRAWL